MDAFFSLSLYFLADLRFYPREGWVLTMCMADPEQSGAECGLLTFRRLVWKSHYISLCAFYLIP